MRCAFCDEEVRLPPLSGRSATIRCRPSRCVITSPDAGSLWSTRARSWRSKIAKRQSDQLPLERRVWRIEKLDDAETRRLLEHAARIGEGLETESAVGFPESALADSAEWKIELIEMNERIVHHRPARPSLLQHAVNDAAFAAEEVQHQRPFALVDDLQRLGQIAIRNHRKQRTENLLAHRRRIAGNVLHDRHRHLA